MSLLSFSSFAIAVISLLVSIAAFVWAGNEGSKSLRYGLGIFFFLLTLLFGLLGLFSFIGSNISTPLLGLDANTTVGKCPSTSEEAATLFGGTSQYWRRLVGYEKYAWKYGPAPAGPISNFKIPEGMKGDWWDNFQAHSRVGPAEGGYASEATIWCVP